jgi:predicted permease
MGELWRRLWYLLNHSRFERELREEMEAHRALKGSSGPPFGNDLRLRDEAVDAWGWRWLERLVQDLRFAARLLWRAPVFTFTAMVVLALGIGLNLAAFQVIDSVVLSWLPVRSPETLVNLYRRSPQSTTTSFSYPAFDFYRRSGSSPNGLTGAMAVVSAGVTLGSDETRAVAAQFVTANYFSELGVVPLAGRLLDSSDDRADAGAVIVLSERLWRARFGGEPSVIGRRLEVNGQPFTVVGITSGSFVGPGGNSAVAWIPIGQHRAAFPGSTLLEDWSADTLSFYGRVREGGAAAAEAELKTAVDGLRAVRPGDVRDGEWLELRPAGRIVSLEEAAPGIALIFALVGLVLLAACMNLGLLVLARTLARDREFAIRLSVGATRGRIVRQLLTEHLLLGVLGAIVACFVAVQASRAVLSLTGASGGLQPQFNLRLLVVAALLAIISSVAFGFAPAWQALRPAAPGRVRLRTILVGLQVTAATALLIVSGLLVRGVTRVVRVPLGFDYQQTLMAEPHLDNHGVSPDVARAYWDGVETRLRQVPGVLNVAVTSLPPFGNRVWVNGEGTIYYHVTPAYFETMQIPLKRGRVFDPGEPGVVLVSETLARRRWPTEEALGKTFDDLTVIGVVGDARTVRVGEQSATESYFPIESKQLAEAVMVVRVDGLPSRAVATVRTAMRADDARLRPSVVPLRDAFEERLAGPRQFALIASALGLCALLLAVTGLGGMVAFTVSQRLREIGVRLALGARPVHVVRAIARQFTRPVAFGAVAGSALAAGVGMILSRELFGVSGLDPLTHGAALLLFAVVAAAAAMPSLRRAISIDPIQTLRHD